MKGSTLLSRLRFRFRLVSALPGDKDHKALQGWLKAASGAEALTLWWQREAKKTDPLTEGQTVACLGFFTGLLAGKTARPKEEELALCMAIRTRTGDIKAFSEAFRQGLSRGLHTPLKKDRLRKELVSATSEAQIPLIDDIIKVITQ